MFQLTQSPFLQALGFAIINSLWQFALLWLIYVLVNSLIKFSSPQKYVTALTLHIAGFTWFTGTLIFYYNQCQQLAANSFETPVGFFMNANSFSGSSVKDVILTLLYRAEYFLPYLSVAYIILIVFLAIKTIQCYRNTQLLRTQGLQKINVEWRLFVQQLSYQLGIKKPVKIYISNLVTSPITLGFLKPLILLPFATVTNLNTQQIEAVLLHELAHIKRHDYCINLILSIIEISLFFNPFMQLISRHIKRERENSCDDWVLQYNYNATSYAKALLTIANNKSKISSHLAMNATSDNRALLIRVKRMIEKKDRSFNYRQHLVALVFIAGIFSSVTWLSPAKHGFSSAKTSGVIKNIKVQPIVAKVNNPFFNPVFFLMDGDKKKTQITKREVPQIEQPIVNITPSFTNEEDIPKANEAIIDDIMPIAQELQIEKITDKINAKAIAIDSINQIISKTIFNKAAASINFKKVEHDILRSKFELESLKGKDYKKLQALHQQINNAVAEIKKLNLQFSNNILKVVYTQRNTNSNSAVLSEVNTGERSQFNILNQQKIAAELDKNLAELQQNLFIRTKVDDAELSDLTTLESDCNSSPAASNNENNNWSYSYQYSDDPAIKNAIVICPAATSKTVSVELKKIQEVKEEQPSIKPETPQPAKAITIKRNRVVRI